MSRNSKIDIESVVLALALAGVAAIIFTGLALYDQNHQTKTQADNRPFYCAVPYNLEYCHAHQDEMYQIKAQRGEQL